MSLDADIERTWASLGTTPATKKQIIRTLVEVIVVRLDGETIEPVIHWQGGAHSALAVRKNRCGRHRWKTDSDVVVLTRTLARLIPDKLIASALILAMAMETGGLAMSPLHKQSTENARRLG